MIIFAALASIILGVAAFKTYTQWGPDGKGFFMTDDVGIAFVERARQVGVHNIAIHKGLAFGPKSYEHSTSRDIGPIAKRTRVPGVLAGVSSCRRNATNGRTCRFRPFTASVVRLGGRAAPARGN